jgi:hypothetical protein
MSLTEYRQGTVIVGEDTPFDCLSLITKGSVDLLFGTQAIRLEKGDVIGLCGLITGRTMHTWTAATDAALFSYPCGGYDQLQQLLHENTDVAYLLINSVCRQTAEFLRRMSALVLETATVADALESLYSEYERLCAQYAYTPKKLPGLQGITRFSNPEPVDEWLHEYYTEMNSHDPALRKSFFYGKPGISFSFLRRCAEDTAVIHRVCKSCRDYIKSVSRFYLNEDGHDVFSLVSDLYCNSTHIKDAGDVVGSLLSQVDSMITGMTGIDTEYYQTRYDAYQTRLSAKQTPPDIPASASEPGRQIAKQNLSDTMEIILSYSDCEEETYNRFVRNVRDYTKLADRNGSDDDARRLRKELTEQFFEVYRLVMIKSLSDTALPTVIKMFLNFGYVDADLAGHENADYLYSIADSVKGSPDTGIYTIREWLTAVYNGTKEPSRNEFDTDYTEHVHKVKQERKLDAETVARMLRDQDAKLRYEMDNVFPTANKITFGRVITYCPLFADHNVQRSLDDSLIRPDVLTAAFDEVRGIDHSAYYRATLYNNTKLDIRNVTVHVEIRPDIILMPIVGNRGSMWQEIEGKDRATPARMFMPLFHENDIKTLVLRLTGEFRWEMCKRIQGMRWNDITEPSLTSEYSDFLQFYKANKTLSVEAKEDLKADLSRARNNYKTVFVNDYREWILFEANTSPRLNKAALAMMVTYCPFSKPIREKMALHPRYSELLTRYNFKQMKRIQFVERIVQRLTVTGKQIPKEIKDELDYAKR